MTGSGADEESVGYEQARRLLHTVESGGIDRRNLWLHYFSIGGDVSEFEVDAYLHHSMLLPQLQRDLLAHAANELLAERRPREAPYSADLERAGSATDGAGDSTDRTSIRDSDVKDHGESDSAEEDD